MSVAAATEEERRSRLAAFLIGQRERIPLEAPALEPYARLRVRRGRPVSAPEIARAIGVGERWYALVEQGVPTPTSRSSFSKRTRRNSGIREGSLPHQAWTRRQRPVVGESRDITGAAEVLLLRRSRIKSNAVREPHRNEYKS
jgi:hypothetical protein